jgi:hypothetical protein
MSKHLDFISHSTSWHGGVAVVVALLLSPLPSHADPLKGSRSGVTLENTAPKVKKGTSESQPHVVNLKRLCSWKEYPQAGFPKSGFCRWSDGARVGTPCSCTRTVEHAKEEHEGSVIEAPPSGESTPVR